LRLFPIIDDCEQVVGVAGTGEDITARKAVEGQLASALDMALESRHLASLGIMAAGIAHEINQPLQAIKLSSDSVTYWFEKKNKFDPETIMKALGLISRNADRIGRIIQRMRKFVKSRQAVKIIAAVDLNQAIRDSVEMLETQLKSHGIELFLELDADLSKAAGEETQMEEIIINLVTNAVQSLEQAGTLDKRIRIQTIEQEDVVCLIVSDTGTGFSEESRHNLFQPFFTTKTDGLGLGLSIVHSIVSGFSGKIELLNPSTGYSTDLSVTLPKWCEEQ
jgi:C4-dicarboxylate-specific signal transduction histidine kinase